MSGLPSPSSYMTVQAHTQASSAARRRGSDSSNEGVRWQETMGEKWYIGGRNARGEEKYFKMGVVRRDRSLDRGSIDRMSL